MLKSMLLGSVSHLPFFAPLNEGAGGSTPAPDADASPAAAEVPAGGAAPAAAAAAPPAAVDASKPEGAPGNVLADLKPAVPAETPEAKATREAREELLKNETPEAKAARELAEKTETDKAAAEANKVRVDANLKALEPLKIPDGVDPAQPAVVDFKQECAALDIPLDKAQQLMDKIAPQFAAAVNAPYQEWYTTQKGWIEGCAKDPEYGGGKYEENLRYCAIALDSPLCDGKKMRDMLAFTGAGNNPEMVRWMYRVGKMLDEGGPVKDKPITPEASLAEAMYPTMKPKDAAA